MRLNAKRERRLVVAIATGNEFTIYEQILARLSSRFEDMADRIEVIFFSLIEKDRNRNGGQMLKLCSNRGDCWEIDIPLSKYTMLDSLKGPGIRCTGQWSNFERAWINIRDIILYRFLCNLVEGDFILFKGTLTSAYDVDAVLELAKLFSGRRFFGGRIHTFLFEGRLFPIASGAGTWLSRELIEKMVLFEDSDFFLENIYLPNDVLLGLGLRGEPIHPLTRYDVIGPPIRSDADLVKAYLSIKSTIGMHKYWHVRIKLSSRGDLGRSNFTDERYEVDLHQKVFGFLNSTRVKTAWCFPTIFSPQ
jgi:hypothetical protein